MKRWRRANLVMVSVAVLLLAVFAMFVRPAVTADSVALLGASGMTCGSCAGKIEKALKRNRGVAAVEVDLDQGMVLVAYDRSQASPEAFARQVTDTGYASSLRRVLTVDEFTAMAGRAVPGQLGQQAGCACCSTRK